MSEHTPTARRLKKHPCIALLTDFGLRDHYVASVHAVLASINPLVRIIDISHEVEPQNIKEGGYILWAAYKYFPTGTVFMCVIDPGVGTEREINIARCRDCTFLAPDNGLLDFVLNSQTEAKIFRVNVNKMQRYLPPTVSTTFHGRDIFAPLAAHIASGLRPEAVATRINLHETFSGFVSGKDDVGKPAILHIDRFGNIITNIRFGATEGAKIAIELVGVGTSMVSMWIRSYAEAPLNTPCLLLGSDGLVEIAVKNDSAARVLNASTATHLKVYWR